jgi:(2Fe-2S) ferredoxin
MKAKTDASRRVRWHFFVCVNERPPETLMPSCAPQGGREVYQAIVREIARRGYPDGVKVTSTSCLTPCQCGPNVVVYPEGTWYAGVTEADVPDLLDSHLLNDQPLTRLLLPENVRVV